MRKPQRLTPEQASSWVPDPPPPGGLVDWAQFFPKPGPVELEIGFGKGAFLVASAEKHSDVNFLGVEHERKYAFLAASRLARRGLTNARVFAADGSRLLALNIPAQSVSAIHLYFPDPWWKTRHHKRRIMTPAFLMAVAKALKTGHPFHMATDVEDYFLNTLKLLENCSSLSLQQAWHCRDTPPPEAVVTNFERKAHAQGRSVFRLIATTKAEHSGSNIKVE